MHEDAPSRMDGAREAEEAREPEDLYLGDAIHFLLSAKRSGAA